MLFAAVLRYRKMIIATTFAFYIGCGLTMSLLRVDCAETKVDKTSKIYAKAAAQSKTHSIQDAEYVILVLSGPKNVKLRDTIRTTWSTLVDNLVTENNERFYRWNHTRSSDRSKHHFVKTLFVIGLKDLNGDDTNNLELEAWRAGDMILLDNVKDSYDKLAHKMIASMLWLDVNIPGLKYVIKVDDDSFVRPDLIVSELDANGHDINVPQVRREGNKKEVLKGLYWGYFDGKARVYLDGKWKEEDWFLCNKYLPYALGGGYIISQSIVSYIARNSDILREYKSEDVSMGVWTAALDGINRVHDVRFDTEWTSRGCQNNQLIRHKQSSLDMFSMYSSLVQSKGKKLCEKEFTKRSPYVYKWNVLPTMCCNVDN